MYGDNKKVTSPF